MRAPIARRAWLKCPFAFLPKINQRNHLMSNWPVRISKLASSRDARSISCDRGGAFLGAIPLLETRGNVWQARPVAALNKESGFLYGVAVDFTSKLDGLAVIASALNDSKIVKAKIAAVQLRLPELPARTPRNRHEVIDVAWKLFDAGILSKTWDPERHPRWPSGQSDGGRFRPSDGSSAEQDQSAAHEQIATDPAKFTECNERCSKLLERYRTYSWSNVNEFHYRQCMNQCLGIG
jgi:hypothetical protein